MPVSPTLGFGWAGWLPRCNVRYTYSCGHRPHPFCALFPPPRELQCVRPVDRNDKSTRPPRTPRRPCDRTRRVSNTCTWIMVANCTPIPPRFTPHQKCWAVKITRFSPKVAPHSRMTAQSGDWCRFELSSGRQRADAHARSQSTHIAQESQALPSLLDAPPPLAQLACATPASALLMAGAACPLPALLGGAHFPPARPRAPDGCPCTLTRSARCPNPSLPVCRRCGSLTATIIGARALRRARYASLWLVVRQVGWLIRMTSDSQIIDRQ